MMNSRFLSIDGLRGLAILLVIVYHTYARWESHIPWASTNKEFILFKFGFVGVQLFFLISGFVIYMTLEKTHSFTEFLFKRWLRLFPAIIICTSIIFMTSPFLAERPGGLVNPTDVIPGVLLIDHKLLNYFLPNVKSIEGVFWSLYVEVKFYLLFGFLYFKFKTKSLNIFCILYLIIFTHQIAIDFFGNDVKINFLYITANLLNFKHFGWFYIGSLLYKYSITSNRYILLISFIMLLPTIYLTGKGQIFVYLIYIALYFLFLSCIYIKFIGNIFTNKTLLFFGFISYPLYLIHENAMVSLTIKTHNVLGIKGMLSPLPGLILITGLSYIIAKYLEPLMRKKIFYIKSLRYNLLKLK